MRKSQRTANCNHIQALLDQGFSRNQLADAFGVARNTTIHGWLHEGHAPKWTLLATEALRRRTNTGNKVVLLVVGSGKDIEFIKSMSDRLTGLDVTELIV